MTVLNYPSSSTASVRCARRRGGRRFAGRRAATPCRASTATCTCKASASAVSPTSTNTLGCACVSQPVCVCVSHTHTQRESTRERMELPPRTPPGDAGISHETGEPGAQALHLENNLISEIEGLSHMTTLRVLYLDRNMLTHVGGLEGCGALDTLHVTSNQIQRLDCLPPRCRDCSLPGRRASRSPVLTRNKININPQARQWFQPSSPTLSSPSALGVRSFNTQQLPVVSTSVFTNSSWLAFGREG